MSASRIRYRAAAVAGAAALVVAGGFTTAAAAPNAPSPALARLAGATRSSTLKSSTSAYPDPRCSSWQPLVYYCLWYHPDSGGSMWVSYWAHNPDIKYANNYRFITAGAGQGQYVRANAATVGAGGAMSGFSCATVYRRENYEGASQSVPWGEAESLDSELRNHDYSIQVTGC